MKEIPQMGFRDLLRKRDADRRRYGHPRRRHNPPPQPRRAGDKKNDKRIFISQKRYYLVIKDNATFYIIHIFNSAQIIT